MSVNTDKPILVFPAGMPKAVEFMQRCKREGRTLVGASSLAFDPVRESYDHWRSLPYVTEASFGEQLAALIRELDIGGVYSPNIVVWDFLDRHLKSLAPGVALLNASPVDSALEGYRSAVERARRDAARSLHLQSPGVERAPLSELARAAIYRYVDGIPGMCDHEKLAALFEIARRSPSGDLVEIGSWWGKSAAILVSLAKAHDIGNLLCVDPWSPTHLIQNDSSGMVDNLAASVNTDEALSIFQLGLIPCGAGRINFLRLPSTEAAQVYQREYSVTSGAFGTTRYDGDIAILHIDGNHAYDAVQADIQAWWPKVKPGGWMILDDYQWPFGDGPRVAGDEFLAAHAATLHQAFAMGSALFIQRR